MPTNRRGIEREMGLRGLRSIGDIGRDLLAARPGEWR